jgi:hypothetical protein
LGNREIALRKESATRAPILGSLAWRGDINGIGRDLLCYAWLPLIVVFLVCKAPKDGKLAQLAAVKDTLRQETGKKLSFITTDQSRNVI